MEGHEASHELEEKPKLLEALDRNHSILQEPRLQRDDMSIVVGKESVTMPR